MKKRKLWVLSGNIQNAVLCMEDDNRRATTSAGRTSDLFRAARDLCTALCELQFAISVNHGPHFWTHLCSSFLLSFDLPLPCCLSPLYLPWCRKGSKCPGCHLQLELLLLLSMMPTNGITTAVSGAMECPDHYSSWGTGEFQDPLSRSLQVQEVQIIPVSLCLPSDVFSSSIRKCTAIHPLSQTRQEFPAQCHH